MNPGGPEWFRRDRRAKPLVAVVRLADLQPFCKTVFQFEAVLLCCLCEDVLLSTHHRVVLRMTHL